MKFSRLLILFMSLTMKSFSEPGIIMAVSDNYIHIAIPAIAFIRFHHQSSIPIEIWHAGDELSDSAKKLLELFQPLVIRDISEHYPYPPTFFQGFQIKGFMVETTHFDEFLLMDADVFLYMPPEEFFELPQYKKTGAFFFRDNTNSIWSPRFTSIYEKREAFLNKEIPSPSNFLPEEWKYYWEEKDVRALKNKPRHHIESGVLLINKSFHKKSLASIRHLNEDYQEIYQFLPGDKETFWIGLEKEKEPYAINSTPAFCLVPNPIYLTYDPLFQRIRTPNRLVHCIDNKLSFQQKVPIPVSRFSTLVPRSLDKSAARHLTSEERHLIEKARLYYEIFHKLDLLSENSVSRVKPGHG